MRCRLAALLFVILFSSFAAHAEGAISILKRDGTRVRGTLVSETDRGFLVDENGKTVFVSYNEIKALTHDGTLNGPLAQGTPAEGARPSQEISFGGGLNWGPTVNERSEDRYYEIGPTLQASVEFPGDKIGFRLTPIFNFGFAGPNQWRRFGELELLAEMRLYLTRNFSVGFGAFAGGGLTNDPGGYSSSYAGYGTFGASVTPLAFRFGERQQHEVELAVAVVIDVASGHSGVDSIRPSLLYVHHL